MAENINDIIDLIHPAASGIGVFTTDQAFIVFDRAIDETTIAGGNFFLTGPDFDTWIGPDLQLFHEAASSGSGSDDILASPGFQGIVQGEIAFDRVSLTDPPTTISGVDTIGSGLLYRTRATFTPTNRLANDTEYNVYLSGDEDLSNTLNTGIAERTVFDPVASGTNTGTGVAEFKGGYVGPVDDIFKVTITVAGDVDNARFVFERAIDPLSVFGPFPTRRSGTLLQDGVTVEFADGQYDMGDSWIAILRKPTYFFGNLNWSFKTGSGSVQSIPDSTSTTVLGDIPAPQTAPTGGSSTGTSTFTLNSSNPADLATNLCIPAGEYKITANMSGVVDPATVTSGVVAVVTSELVDGSQCTPSGLIVEPMASGQQLCLTVASGQLMQNQLIKVTLDSTLADIAGTSLGTNVSFCFTTEYFPLYCSVRRLRLFIGLFINEVPDDTLNFAIHEASKMADALTWNKSNLDSDYYKFARQEWVCCKAAEILLLNVTGGSGALKSKRLGDLAVEFDTTGANTNQALQRAFDCQAKWEGALMAGGQQVQAPGVAVKGACDPDRPVVGRGWLHSRNLHIPGNPVANLRVVPRGSRRAKNVFGRSPRGWWNR